MLRFSLVFWCSGDNVRGRLRRCYKSVIAASIHMPYSTLFDCADVLVRAGLLRFKAGESRLTLADGMREHGLKLTDAVERFFMTRVDVFYYAYNRLCIRGMTMVYTQNIVLHGGSSVNPVIIYQPASKS